jgi:hypothetical protein
MIRIACDQCGRPLRAPDDLAGKHGRCAHCGAVNPVPSTLPVGVKRFPGSPFRSADRPTRSAIEGTTDVPPAAFYAAQPTDPEAGAIERTGTNEPREFVDRITSQITEASASFPLLADATRVRGDTTARADAAPPLDVDPLLEEDDGSGGDEGAEVLDATAVVRRAGDGRAAVAVALITGALFGFALGLLAAKWLL